MTDRYGGVQLGGGRVVVGGVVGWVNWLFGGERSEGEGLLLQVQKRSAMGAGCKGGTRRRP